MKMDDTMSQVDLNKSIIQRYFEAYNTKNEAKFDDINYTIEEMIASEAYPDLVGTYWKGSLTPNAATSETVKSNKIINYSGISIYHLQNGKNDGNAACN